MIQAKDLRIGNLVFNNENKISKICEVSHIGTVLLNDLTFWQPDAEWGVHCNELQPIPLTLEILEKVGFKYMYIPPKEHYFDNSIAVINTYKTKDAFYYQSQLCDVAIEYVHQLQNLYYSLTGTELTIEL